MCGKGAADKNPQQMPGLSSTLQLSAVMQQRPASCCTDNGCCSISCCCCQLLLRQLSRLVCCPAPATSRKSASYCSMLKCLCITVRISTAIVKILRLPSIFVVVGLKYSCSTVQMAQDKAGGWAGAGARVEECCICVLEERSGEGRLN